MAKVKMPLLGSMSKADLIKQVQKLQKRITKLEAVPKPSAVAALQELPPDKQTDWQDANQDQVNSGAMFPWGPK